MDIIEKIKELKIERQAIILAHNYQRPEIQDIADFVGDSLGLSLAAAKTEARAIVFCGVWFMAETAKILAPEKTVLVPDPHAGCPMADMITAGQLRELKKQHPEAKVLCYVNTSAEVKAEADLCCTSANAVQMVRGPLKDAPEIIFVPDQYLAAYVSGQTGRQFITGNGYCPTHVRITREHILEVKKIHPGAEILVHPECTPEVTAIADQVLSTEGMIKYVKISPNTEFIIGTEIGVIHRMKKKAPGNIYFPVKLTITCPNMKLTTLDKVLLALEEMNPRVEIPENISVRARSSIQKMLDFSE